MAGRAEIITIPSDYDIHALPSTSSINGGDELPFYSQSAVDERKITFDNLKAAVTYNNRAFGFRRLVASHTASGTVSVTADTVMLESVSTGAVLRVNGVSGNANIATSGVNGLDTGSEANDAWYYIWVISNGTQTALLLSASASSPVLPSGYEYRALVSMVRNDASGNFVPFVQRGTRYVYTAAVFLDKPLVHSGLTPTITNISSNLAKAVPPQAVSVTFDAYLTASPADVRAGQLQFYYKPDSPGVGVLCRRFVQLDSSNGVIIEEWASSIEVPIVIPQTMGVDTTAGLLLDLRVLAFQIDI